MDISLVCGALHFDVFKMERLDGDVWHSCIHVYVDITDELSI